MAILTDLIAKTSAVATDLLYFVDVDDVTQNPAGSSFKITKSDFLEDYLKSTGDTMTGVLTTTSNMIFDLASNSGILTGGNDQRMLIGGGTNWAGANGAYIEIQGIDYGGVGLGGDLRFLMPSGAEAYFSQIIRTAGNEVEIEGASPRVDFVETGATNNWNIIVDAEAMDFRRSGASDTELRLNSTGILESRVGAEGIRMVGSSTGIANVSYLTWYESNATTRQGYVGFGSGTDSDLRMFNDANNTYIELDGSGQTMTYRGVSPSGNTVLRAYSGASALADLGANSSGGYVQLTGVGVSVSSIRSYGDSEFHGGGVQASAFTTINNTSTADSGNFDSEDYTLPTYSIFTSSNTTGSTGFPATTGQALWIKGAGENRNFALWKRASNGNVDDFYVGVQETGTWSWYKSLNEGTLNATIYDGASNLLWEWKSQGDVSLKLSADSDNVDESHNPALILSQDGDTKFGYFQLEGAAGTIMTGSVADSLLIRTLASTEDIHFGYGSTITMDIDNGTGDVTAADFVLSSDRRLKKDISDIRIDGAPVRWVNYRLKDSNEDTALKGGVIAQELQEIYPEFVSEKADGMLKVHYNSLFAAEHARKDKKIAELEDRVDQLEQLIMTKL